MLLIGQIANPTLYGRSHISVPYRIVDRDMIMRYHWGLGVGHVYSHEKITHPSPTIQADYTDPISISGAQDSLQLKEAEIAVNIGIDLDMVPRHIQQAENLSGGDDDGYSDRSVEEEYVNSDSENSNSLEDEEEGESEPSSDDSDMEDIYGDPVDPAESTSYD